MTRLEFSAPGRIIFGEGTFGEIGSLAAQFGKKALLAAGHHGAALNRLVTLLEASQVAYERFDIHSEPSVEGAQAGVRLAREAGCDLVIGFGGGSAIDTAKAISALLTNPGDPLDYLEVVGRGMALTQPAAPCIAVPTTAGTGSEVTRNAVLSVPAQGVKVSLRSPLMLPRIALVDPELTYNLPPHITAATGMDAMAQVIEPFVSSRANPLTDLYSREGIIRAARSLSVAYRDGSNTEARADMAFTSLMGGLALANAGLGAVHGFAGVIGGKFNAPHGAICAALLPAVVQINARALQDRSPNHPAVLKYMEIARLIVDSNSVSTLALWLSKLRASLQIPGLGQYGIMPAHISQLVEQSAAASSMKANPIRLTQDELVEILEKSL